MNTQRRSSSKSRITRKPATRKLPLQRFSLPELLEARMMLSATIFNVTSTADTGMGTLREAIGLVNTDADPTAVDTITFTLPTGSTTISLTSRPLPKLTHAVVIDGLDTASTATMSKLTAP